MNTTNTDFLPTKHDNPYCRVVGVNGSFNYQLNKNQNYEF